MVDILPATFEIDPAGPTDGAHPQAAVDAAKDAPATRQPSRGLSSWLFGRVLDGLATGSITVTLPGGRTMVRRTGVPGPDATLVLHRHRALRSLVFGGDVGFAEAYVRGDWSSPDLTSLIELAASNGAGIIDRVAGWWPKRLANLISHRARANTREGSRRNIQFHYDLGNEFYRLWLCRRMLYSSGLYTTPTDTLEDAQEHKLDAVVAALAPAPGDRVLEIGCGWGALAERMVRHCGGSVTGVTLSPAQLSEAKQVAPGADLRLQDYRDIEGTFDRIVSIEMIEAVGERFLPSYFAALSSRLAPGGRIVVQAITIAEERFASYRAHPDFIQSYIFPGGFLPTKALIKRQLEEAGLRLHGMQSFGPSYARTLRDWRLRFEAAWPRIQQLGFDDAFRRLWTYYLCYCEAGFRAGVLDVGLYIMKHRGDGA